MTVQRQGDITDPRAMGAYMKTGFINGLPKGLIDAILQGFEGDPSRATVIFTQQSGGAINRVAPDATAFAHRDAQHNLLVNVGWKMGTDGAPHMAWARKYWTTIEPFTAGFYINEVNDESARDDRRELSAELRAAGDDQEPVRSDEPVPAERERHTYGVVGPGVRGLGRTAAAISEGSGTMTTCPHPRR